MTFVGEIREVDERPEPRSPTSSPSARPPSIALSGGETAEQAYAALATRGLDWSGTEVFLGDERFVPVTDPDSNEGMIRRVLFATQRAAGDALDGRGRAHGRGRGRRVRRARARDRPDRARAPRARPGRAHRVAVPRRGDARHHRPAGGQRRRRAAPAPAPHVHLPRDRPVAAGGVHGRRCGEARRVRAGVAPATRRCPRATCAPTRSSGSSTPPPSADPRRHTFRGVQPSPERR